MTMRSVILAGLFFLLCTDTKAQFIPAAKDMAVAYANLTSSAASPLLINPAIISRTPESITANLIPAPFGLSKLARYSLEYSTVLDSIPAALQISSYGNSLYRENFITLGTAFSFSELFSVGVGLSGGGVFITNFDPVYQFTLSVGMITSPIPEIEAGIVLKNLPIGIREFTPNITGAAGITFIPIQQMKISIGMYQEYFTKAYAVSGIEFFPIEYISVKSGYISNTSSLTLGLGLHLRNYTLDYGYMSHPSLGSVEQISVSIGL